MSLDRRLNPLPWAAVAITVVATGCATLNESECRQAEWRTVGYADGAAGRPAGRIDRHREACAPHGVTPDLDAYRAGRRQGLEHFCRAASGFRLGESGAEYGGVCPPALEAHFMAGYQAGLRLFHLAAEVNEARRELRRLERELERLERDEREARERLVEGDSDRATRSELLARVVEARDRRPSLEATIRAAERHLNHRRWRLEAARRDSSYPAGP